MRNNIQLYLLKIQIDMIDPLHRAFITSLSNPTRKKNI